MRKIPYIAQAGDVGSLDLTTVVTRVSNIFKKHGLKDVDEIQEVCGVLHRLIFSCYIKI